MLFCDKICLENILEILEVPDQIYLNISVVVLFKFVSSCNFL